MISVLIETQNDEEALARTLASLVGGAVDGLVREVIVCDDGSTDATRRVADEAGCALLEGTAGEGVARAKGDWLLMLEPGARLADGWLEPAAAHMAKSTIPAHFTRARAQRAPFLSRVFGGNRALANGLLIRRSQAAALAKNARDAEALARGLATRQIAAEIFPAPKR